MITILKKELYKSITEANELTQKLSKPKNKWEYYVRLLFKIEIMLEDLLEKELINQRQEQEIRNSIAPISYWTILNSPDLQENKKIKKEVKLSLLNDNLKCIGLSKHICFIDCK